MIKLLLALLLLASPAFAQTGTYQTKPSMQTEINTNLPDNSSGLITPLVMRNTLSDMLASWQQIGNVNPQTGTSYTIAVGDNGKLVTVNNASPVGVALPQATGSFANFTVAISNIGTGLATVTPVTSTIGGLASTTIPPGQAIYVYSDGTNYQLTRTNALAGSGQQGFVTVWFSNALNQWVYTTETGAVITAASSTCQLQEALNYAYGTSSPKNLSVVYYGQGAANPCNITNTTVTVPAQHNNSFYGYGMVLNFTNVGQSGLIFDTQRYGQWNCQGCVINYSGTGFAAGVQPTHAPGGGACTAADTNCWAIDYEYNIGGLFASGSTPAALWLEDVTQGNGVNQLRSSTFGTNTIRFTGLECQANAAYGIRIFSPVNAFQAGGENSYYFNNIEGCTISEFNIGGSSVNDVSLGTNLYVGNVAHTSATASTFAITTDASLDQFILTSDNCYNASTGQANVFWGANATNNVIQTKQLIGCNSIEAGTTQTFAMNNWISGVWRAYTPTLSCQTGTLSSASATGRAIRPNPYGKLVNFEVNVVITTIGTCATYVQATLPVNANQEHEAFGRETQATGFQLQAKIPSGTSNLQIQKYDGSCTNGSAPCNSGNTLVVNGLYESQ